MFLRFRLEFECSFLMRTITEFRESLEIVGKHQNLCQRRAKRSYVQRVVCLNSFKDTKCG